MNRDEAREQAKHYLKEYADHMLTKSKGTSGNYNCPCCGSGTGKKGTGALSVNGDMWKCFSCGESGDLLDLIGAVEGIEGYNNRLNKAVEFAGISIDEATASAEDAAYKNRDTRTKSEQRETAMIKTDYTAFFLQAHQNINDTDYWQQRGLSRETVDQFKIGFIKDWRHPKNPNGEPTDRLIIPISKHSYLARAVTDDLPEGVAKKLKVKGSERPIWTFNHKALDTAEQPIFIVEGEIDAMSIVEVGGEAVGIGSTAFVKGFIELCKEKRPEQTFIISLDNDKAGTEAAAKLEKAFKDMNITSYRFNPCEDYKDPNEALQKDRTNFGKTVRAVTSAALRGTLSEYIEEYEQNKLREKYIQNSAASHLQEFVDGIASSVDTPYIPTGFPKLDNALDGGLYEGLYFVGAISSLGKTTLCLQLMDQIAKNGNDVIIFSLEMARTELMAKSISRITLTKTIAEGGNTRDAKTTRGITVGKRYAHYSELEKNLIKNSVIEYGEYAEHIFIHEGIGSIGVKEIREAISTHIMCTGNKPVVLIDYIQLLAPADVRATDKQNTDNAVLELKRISRDFKIPLIGISSFNRQNYSEAVTMAAFKESGAIEYTSDVLIGLQLKGAGEKDFKVTEEKRKDPREIELIILKNRNGAIRDKIPYEYHPKFNYFEEEL